MEWVLNLDDLDREYGMVTFDMEYENDLEPVARDNWLKEFQGNTEP